MRVWDIKEKVMDNKRKKSGSISKETENNPVDAVSLDQFQSDQPV